MKKFGLLVLSTAAVVMFVGDLNAMNNQPGSNQGAFVPFKPTLRGREASLKHMAEVRARQAAARSTPVQQVKINQLEQQRKEDKKEIENLKEENERLSSKITKLEIQSKKTKEIEDELLALRLQQTEIMQHLAGSNLR